MILLLRWQLSDCGILSLGGNTNVAKSSVKYLDHIMEKNGVRSGRDNLRAIREFERLKDKKM